MDCHLVWDISVKANMKNFMKTGIKGAHPYKQTCTEHIVGLIRTLDTFSYIAAVAVGNCWANLSQVLKSTETETFIYEDSSKDYLCPLPGTMP